MSTLPLGDVHQLFADVDAVEQPEKRLRGVLEAIGDGLAVVDDARVDPAREAFGRLATAVGEVPDQKTLHAGPRRDQSWELARPGRGFLGVVQRDLSTDRHPRADVQVIEHRVGDRSADVIEVDVDAVLAREGRTDLAEAVADGLALVADYEYGRIDSVLESVNERFLSHPGAVSTGTVKSNKKIQDERVSKIKTGFLPEESRPDKDLPDIPESINDVI